jgi:hypothetical protein
MWTIMTSFTATALVWQCGGNGLLVLLAGMAGGLIGASIHWVERILEVGR